MQPIEVFAVAIGLAVLAVLTFISLRGPRDRSGGLRGNDGPVTPLDHGHDGDFDDGH